MHPVRNPNLMVVTGGPGAGKTTLLRELERQGFHCVPEIAREIIRRQVATGGDAVPWGDTTRYSQLMLAGSVESYLQFSHAHEATFFDRGIPDTLCYARLINLPQTAEIESACRNLSLPPASFRRTAVEGNLFHRRRAQADVRRCHKRLSAHGRGVSAVRIRSRGATALESRATSRVRHCEIERRRQRRA